MQIKEYDWNASVAIRPNQNFAPNDNSKLVEQLDKTFSTWAHKQTNRSTFLSQSCSTLFLVLFFLLFFWYSFFYIELNTKIWYDIAHFIILNKNSPNSYNLNRFKVNTMEMMRVFRFFFLWIFSYIYKTLKGNTKIEWPATKQRL